MDLVPVLVGGAIALASAIVITLINNRYERGRIQDVWKLEVQEREAQARRQRLKERLMRVQEDVNDLVQCVALFATAPLGLLSKERAVENQEKSLQLWASVSTAAGAVGDPQLKVAVAEFLNALSTCEGLATKALRGEAGEYVESEELSNAISAVKDNAGKVLRRCDGLLEEAYQEAIAVA